MQKFVNRFLALYLIGSVILMIVIAAACSRPAPVCERLLAEMRALRAKGDFTAAMAVADRGFQTCSDQSLQSERWRFYFFRAETLNYLKEPDKAMAALEPRLPSSAEFAEMRARRLQDLGLAWLTKNEPRRAVRLFDTAAEEAAGDSLPLRKRRAEIARWKAQALGDLSEFEPAREAMDEAARLGESADDVEYAIGYAYLLMREARYEEAVNWYERALAPIESSANPVRKGQLWLNLASCYSRIGDLERALSLLHKAEPLLSGPDLRRCENLIGNVYADGGDRDSALLAYRRALELAKGDEIATAEQLNNIARIQIDLKQWDEAEASNRRALEIKRSRSRAESELYSLVNEARILEGRGENSKALEVLAAVTSRSSPDPAPRIEAESTAIGICRKLGDVSGAQLHYQSAIELTEAMRARLKQDENLLAHFSQIRDVTGEWLRTLVEEGRTEEALAVAEASRARILMERMGQNAPRRSFAALDYARLAREQRAALISFWVMPERSYAWVVTARGIQVFTLPGEQKLGPLVHAQRAFLENRRNPLQTDFPAGAALRQAVLDPLMPALEGERELLVALDGSLHALNLETLPVNGHYWIEDMTISLAPSLNVLLMRRAKAAPKGVLLIGDAAGTPGFPRLLHAADEMQGIAQNFAGNATLFAGNDATPEAYLHAERIPAYLHFSAHASANREAPLDSAVMLSKGASGDRLTARALLTRRLDADLVTISSCRSAGARLYGGEGLVGFAWVFLQLGAGGVIAGLWDASDDATSRLMIEAYRRLAQGTPPAQALRQAKLKLIRHSAEQRLPYDLPYYWAPFEYFRGAGR